MNPFFIIAGEQSADNHGNALMESIQKLDPRTTFVGIGGKKMIARGLISIENIDNLAIMGFIEILKHLPFFNKLKNKVLTEIKLIKPVQIILIDYPGFNLYLAKKIKKKFDIPITYYISPQLWAWKENRIKIIKKYINQVLVIFPFEEDWYKKRGVKAKFVGHPIFDEWTKSSKQNLCKYLNINNNQPIITLFPGSRQQEINRHLPLLIEVAIKMKKIDSSIQFLLGIAHTVNIEKLTIPNWILVEHRYPAKALECANLAIVASGSATLEAAIYETPMIIIYKMSIISWLLSKLLVKTEYAGMVNILANKKIIPEYIQNQATINSILNEALTIMNNNEIVKTMKYEMGLIKKKFPNKGASIMAAEHILNLTK